MSAGTGIEWTEATWNPVSGCTRASEGCNNCPAEWPEDLRVRECPEVKT